MSDSPAGVSSLKTFTTTTPPILMRDRSRMSRTGSRNVTRNRSGRFRLSSTTTDTTASSTSVGTGEPST
jgi:hypothetical protein